MTLANKKILLGVTGGIAAYKAPLIVRLLKKQGADVQVVLSSGAKHFTTATSLQAVSGHPVRDTLWDAAAEASMGHIELARWADAILIAPATADVIARLTYGFANDLLTTLCLATDAPLTIAPAMNRLMYANKATQENILMLEERGINILGPDEGEQACGEFGPGRMLEPEDIVQAFMHMPELSKSGSTSQGPSENKHAYPGLLKGQSVVITAGPTQEAIDPVRFITNHSSGKMGYAVAKIAYLQGARVTLISGPVELPVPEGVKLVRVNTAKEMYTAVMESLDDCNLFISTAAVSDYRPSVVAEQKIKKKSESQSDVLTIELERNPDILATVAQQNPRPVCIGFAAETENLDENALKKLKSKRVDMVAANLVGHGQTFGRDESSLKVFWKGGHEVIEHGPKEKVAEELIEIVSGYIQQNMAQTMIVR